MARHSADTVLDPPPDAAPPQRKTVGDRVRFVLRGIGQTLITAGLVVLLFVFYEVYVTNWFTEHAQAEVRKVLKVEWENGEDPTVAAPDGTYPKLPLGKGIANLYIPRLGSDYEWTIVEGTSLPELDKGPGHYTSSALPGQTGNFAVAGHRVGKGEPFLNLDHLRPGDAVIVETESHWYVYRVKGNVQTGDLSATGSDDIPGREIVDPGDSAVLLPVPDHPGENPTEKLMTMTTCHPKFSAQQRMIVFSELDSALTTKKQSGTSPMPDPIKALYDAVSG